MPVDTKHEAYELTFGQWKRCRDAFEGTDAIKGAGEKYLPMLTSQDQDEYAAYKTRANWFNATARTVIGLQGAVFRKDPFVKFPKTIESYLADITLTGTSLASFAKDAFREQLLTGRFGILVDMPNVSQNEAETNFESRPYAIGYKAENIVNWRVTRIDGKSVLTMVVLCEFVEEIDSNDPFKVDSVEQYRVLLLEDGRYVVRLYRREKLDDSSSQFVQYGPDITPEFRGSALTFIPFQFVNAGSLTSDVQKPPLLDLVDVNLSHYRTTADLEHGRHFCGLPTAWVAGFPVSTRLSIGSGVVWISDDTDAKAGMLEFTGQGLGALEKAEETKKQDMAVLGARLLQSEKRAVEAAETHQLRQAGETSILQSMAITCGDGIRQALEWMAFWSGVKDSEIEVGMNLEFFETTLTPQELDSLMTLWQAGGISQETLYYNLERGRITRPGVTIEEEKKLIEAEMPAESESEDDPDQIGDND